MSSLRSEKLRSFGGPRRLRMETLEARQMMAADTISAVEVKQLLNRAAAASVRQDAIIAVVDRNGNILGVRVEAGVVQNIPDVNTQYFAIDGAVAEARTAAFFSSNEGAITSRTVRQISQSTVTQREVQSNPNVPTLSSPYRGPGFVAPIGVGGHFPAQIQNTPLVDLFAIEHTNRDSIVHPGADSIHGTADDITMLARFNINPAYVSPGQTIAAPETYGFTSKLNLYMQGRGIGTLPGGIPLYKNDILVGGIGVFFPGSYGFADYEQNFIQGIGQTDDQRVNAPLELQAEWIAFAAAGGSSALNAQVGIIGGLAPVPGFDLSANVLKPINLAGLTLDTIGPSGAQGIKQVQMAGVYAGQEYSTYLNVEQNRLIDPLDPNNANPAGFTYHVKDGTPVPAGYLVNPHDGVGITAAQVTTIINQGIQQAVATRSAIRALGSTAHMVLAVSDHNGDVVGLYRMVDAPVFSIDVAVAKSRNVNYYSDPTLLQYYDKVSDPIGPDTTTPYGTAYTNRTFRFLSAPRYPTGAPDGTPAGAFSILRNDFVPASGINPLTAENYGAPVAASVFSSFTTPTLAFDAFNPGRNFRDPRIIYTNNPNQNGIVFFPGSSPLYNGTSIIGGLGISGDGVDQDDTVTYYGAVGFAAPDAIHADNFFIRGVRLPYQKFSRNATG